MTILNLIQCTNLGGMEQASLRLMRGLKARGHIVKLLCLNSMGELAPLLDESSIPYEGLPYRGRGGWKSFPLLKKRIRESNADALIMTGHNLLANLALGDFCKDRRILALHYHHTGVKPAWQWKAIYRVAVNSFNAITFPCDFVRREAAALYPPVGTISHTVRNPLDIPKLPAAAEKLAARHLLGLDPHRPVIGNAGWLIPRKRFDVFLRVAAEVLKELPQASFVIAGDGPERGALESLARELGIFSSIRWLAWQRNMVPFYQAIDVIHFNSDWDALGLTPLEAMSHGVPVVCSVLHGGLSEIINSEQVGVLMPSHDIKALTQSMLRLLRNPQEARTLGLAGRERVEEVGHVEPIVRWHEKMLLGEKNHWPACKSQKDDLKTSGTPAPSLAVLFGRIGPYHFARLRATARTSQTSAIETTRTDTTYAWDVVEGTDGFNRMTLFDSNHSKPVRGIEIARRMKTALDRCQPSVVALPGWVGPEALAALYWCVQTRTPAVMMSESTSWDDRRLPWKEWVKSRIVTMCSAGLVGGAPQLDYLANLGMPRHRIALGYDCVDNAYFMEQSDNARADAEETRNRLGLPERYFLASMRFVEKKNAPRLIQSYRLYREKAEQFGRDHKPWELVILGDGPLKSELRQLISELGVTSNVHLPGFKQYHQLPSYYALAGAFVHTSTVEQWGLVVNEAMASGLPVLVSQRCGCAADLVRNGINGFIFDPYDVDALNRLMFQVANLPKVKLEGMGQASRKMISAWGPERFAQGLSEAVNVAASLPPRRVNIIDRMLLKSLLMRSSA